MKDLSEAELIDIEKRSRDLADSIHEYEHPPRRGRSEEQITDLVGEINYLAEEVLEDVKTLVAWARALSIEAQSMENLAALEEKTSHAGQ